VAAMPPLCGGTASTLAVGIFDGVAVLLGPVGRAYLTLVFLSPLFFVLRVRFKYICRSSFCFFFFFRKKKKKAKRQLS
jgi:hypothetical protein